MELSTDDSQKLCLVGLPCVIALSDKLSKTRVMTMTAGILTFKLLYALIMEVATVCQLIGLLTGLSSKRTREV